MKILHLFSDASKTGPAEPVIDLSRGLLDRGHDVTLAYRLPRFRSGGALPKLVRDSGVPAITDLCLNRYLNPIDTIRDCITLPRLLKREKYQTIHTHLSHDHLLGAALARLMGIRRPIIVRSIHRRDVLRPTLASRFALALADGLIVFTEKFRRAYIQRFGLSRDRIVTVGPSINTTKFDPALPVRDMRAEFGIEPNVPLIGIASRPQPYRRCDIFIEAASIVLKQIPEARFIIVGRSSRIEQSVYEPIRRFNVQGRVLHVGYRLEDYRDTLACMDIFTLLIAGSDGTARAVREAMAMAKPCVVSDQGMLPSIVTHERSGLVCRLDPESLAAAWLDLIRDPQQRCEMGRAARQEAMERFDPERAAALTEHFYQRLLDLRRPVS